MSAHQDTSDEMDRPLTAVSSDRLVCLLRHWTWADEARAAFDRELAELRDDGNLVADRPFGAYYHWCALLCALSEAALDHALLSSSELADLRPDIEGSLPGLRACRELLVVIPTSVERHANVIELLRDPETLDRLRRLHDRYGDVVRKEQMLREVDSLDH